MNIRDHELNFELVTDIPEKILLSITSWKGFDGSAKHSYGNLRFKKSKIELTRRVYRWEIDKNDEWGWDESNIIYKTRTSGFMTKRSVIKYAKTFIKKWFIGDWKLEIED